MRRLPRIFVVLSLFAVLTAAGCKTAKKDEVSSVDTTAMDTQNLGDSDSNQAMGLQTVHFAYDSFALDSEAKNKLRENARILKENSNMTVQLEGHTDERGSIQYNIALGEKRASAVKRYLVDMGISADRLSTISYGEEQPLVRGNNEQAYAKNRRVNFVITSR